MTYAILFLYIYCIYRIPKHRILTVWRFIY